MKAFRKTLILTLFATTAAQAMDNQPKPNRTWKHKLALMVPGPKKTTAISTAIALPILTAILSYFLPEQVGKVALLTTITVASGTLNALIDPIDSEKTDTEDVWKFQHQIIRDEYSKFLQIERNE